MNKQPQQSQQGEYAGPHTARAMDYSGHTLIGVPISDPAPDGSCFFITLDHHMQISITSVLASSITPYDPPEPPPEPECTAAELTETRARLEYLLKMQLDHGISSIGDLRACALTMSDLADVIALENAHAAGHEANASTSAVAGTCRPANDDADAEREGGEISPDYAEDVR